MNIERLTAVRDAIERERDHFYMQYYFSGGRGAEDPYHYFGEPRPAVREDRSIDWCGTSCCVAGFALTLFDNPKRESALDNEGARVFYYSGSTPEADGAELLELDKWQAMALFSAFVDYEYDARKDGWRVTYDIYAANPADGDDLPSDEEVTLRWLDAIIERGEFFFPHEEQSLFPEYRFEVG